MQADMYTGDLLKSTAAGVRARLVEDTGVRFDAGASFRTSPPKPFRSIVAAPEMILGAFLEALAPR